MNEKRVRIYTPEQLERKRAFHRAWRQRQIDAGRCTVCATSPATRGRRCEPCANKSAACSLRRRERLRGLGMCAECGAIPAMPATRRHKIPVCQDCYLGRLAFTYLGSRDRRGDLRAILDRQGWCCAYTGEPLTLGVNDAIDHMDPVKRFPERRGDLANLQYTTRQVNLAKRDLTDAEFRDLARRIVRYEGG